MTTRTAAEVHQVTLPTPFAVGTVNAYLLQSSDVNVLVDCGPKYGPAREALVSQLKQFHLEPRDITALVLTHGHVDHVGLAPLFQREGVPVCALKEVETWLNPGGECDTYRAEFFSALYREMGVPRELIERAVEEIFSLQKLNDRSVVDVCLAIHQPLPWLEDYTVLHVPGHAQAAIALWNERTGELVTGDQLLPHISSNAFIEPEMGEKDGRFAKRTRSLMQYRDNLQVLRELSTRKVYPGHGNPFSGASELITKRLNEQEQRRDSFYNLVSDMPGITTFELAVRYFPRHADQLSLIMSETLGYLDWMGEEGLVRTKPNSDGVLRWCTTA